MTRKGVYPSSGTLHQGRVRADKDWPRTRFLESVLTWEALGFPCLTTSIGVQTTSSSSSKRENSLSTSYQRKLRERTKSGSCSQTTGHLSPNESVPEKGSKLTTPLPLTLSRSSPEKLENPALLLPLHLYLEQVLEHQYRPPFLPHTPHLPLHPPLLLSVPLPQNH